MITKTKAIVLGTTRYLGNLVLVKMYSENKGQSIYIHKGGRKNQTAFMPLNLVEIIVEEKDSRNLQKLKETTVLNGFDKIYLDPEKSAIALFVTELILKVVKEEEGNKALFDYLIESIEKLNSSLVDTKTFHLFFLIGLSQFAGFYPSGQHTSSDSLFDLREGKFCSGYPPHPYFLEGSASESLGKLKDCFEMNTTFDISISDRRALLAALTDYFRLHLPGMVDMKSHLVLQEV
jgi:DNA repair protein RecO (recombination protein O)